MKTINYLAFKKSLEKTGKTFFNLNDLKKFYSGNIGSLKVLLSKWTKRGMIFKLGRGYYTFNLAAVDYLHLATMFDNSSYISFEYALFYYNLIDQAPSVITLATKKRSRKIEMANWTFEYSRLRDDLFFGYELKNKIYIASQEKALADLIYLISRGKRLVELDALDIAKINKTKLNSILKKFPGYTAEKAKELIKKI
ncbi:MAG: hypothetical protein V1688_00235 [bacterium]